MVPYNRDPTQCLDPKSVFKIVASPLVKANTGEAINLALYANRQGVNVTYQWNVTTQPDGSSDTVKNPTGSATCGDGYECAPAGTAPVLVPHNPGQYVLTVSADLDQPDTLEPSVQHAEATLTLTVERAPSDSSGCRISGQRQANLFVILGLGLLMFWRRRR
jgi:hypothetical protein